MPRIHMGGEGITPPYLSTGLDEGEWTASCHCHLTSRNRALNNYWIWGWVDPRASLDSTEERKSSCPCQKSKPGCPARSLVAIQNRPSQLIIHRNILNFSLTSCHLYPSTFLNILYSDACNLGSSLKVTTWKHTFHSTKCMNNSVQGITTQTWYIHKTNWVNQNEFWNNSTMLVSINVTFLSTHSCNTKLETIKKKLCFPCNMSWRAIGLWDVTVPTFSRQSANRCKMNLIQPTPISYQIWISFMSKQGPKYFFFILNSAVRNNCW